MAWSTGAVEAIEDWLPAASWMPVALTARTTRKVPTAVFWAPAPSAMTSVAVAPEVETEESVPAEGTFVSVQGGVGGGGERLREGRLHAIDPAVRMTSCMTSMPATRTGLAPSAGPVAAKEERLPAASRIPVAFVASATVKEPTAVSGAPAPSVIVSVATAAETETEASVPPRGDVRERPRRGAGRVGRERLGEGGEHWSTLPLEFESCITRLDEDRRRLVDGSGRGDRGLVAGSVVDAGRARGEDDTEGADGGVLGAGALGDDERGGRSRGGDRGERSRRGDVRERPGSGVGGGGERLREGRLHAIDPAVRSDVLHDEHARDEDRLGAVRRPRRRKGGEIAGGIADTGGARGKSDRERAHGGVGSSRAFGDRERGDGGGDRDGGECSSARGRSRASTAWCRPSRPRATRRRWRARGRPCRWSSSPASPGSRGSAWLGRRERSRRSRTGCRQRRGCRSRSRRGRHGRCRRRCSGRRRPRR